MPRRQIIFVFLLLIVAKLLLDYFPTTVIAGGYDDQLFVRLGTQIAAGHWLGTYDQLTLAKGPGLPLFLAACHALRLPLNIADPLLYVLFCIVMVRAVEPVIGKGWGSVILFAILLFNPISFGVDNMARVLRERIYPALSGIALAGAIAIYLRRNESPRRVWAWGVLLAVSLAVGWITREEGIWLWPSLAILAGAAVVGVVRSSEKRRGWRIAMVLAPLALAACLVGVVAGINWMEYGRFLIVEFKDPAFVSAYGAMTRVDPADQRRFVPVSSQALRMMYRTCPAVAELQPYLNGPNGQFWKNLTHETFPRIKGEIGGAWFCWVLRDAVAASGHAGNATEAEHFYAAIASQINAACDTGRLPSGPPRQSLVPPIHWSDWRDILYTGRWGVRMVVHFHRFDAQLLPSQAMPETVQQFQSLIGGSIVPARGLPAEPVSRPTALRLHLLAGIINVYGAIVPTITYLSLLVFLFLLIRCMRGGAPSVCLIAAALLIAAACMIGIIDLFSVTTYPGVVCPLYLSAAYPPLLAFDGLMTLELIALLRRVKLRRCSAARSEIKL
ncbi:MAG TPA: hypothetical protein VMD30_01960 [Tepidisphaeraceae bacterium]|nr:hypothetical protein [Tepidisphaeraceae bacterium]